MPEFVEKVKQSEHWQHQAVVPNLLAPRRGDLVMKNWDEVERASTDQILAWAETQPWALAMAECQQDAEWHAEGDVWTHTRMVVAEVERLPEWPSLDRDSQLEVVVHGPVSRRGKASHDAGRSGNGANAFAQARACRHGDRSRSASGSWLRSLHS